MKRQRQVEREQDRRSRDAIGPNLHQWQGIVGWLLRRLNPSARVGSRLVVLERVNLAPHQSLALVEADGRRLLVGTSPDAALSFYSLDGTETPAAPLRSNAIEIRGHVC